MQPDLSSVISKVLERVAARCVQLAPAQGPAAGAVEPTELIADALAIQILRLLGIGGEGDAHAEPPRDDPQGVGDRLAARSEAMARAVGACACWGEEAGCPDCDGLGGPGWRRPDRTAFDAFVAPMLRKMRQHRGRALRQ